MRAKIGTLLAAIAGAIGTLWAATWARRKQSEDKLDLEVSDVPSTARSSEATPMSVPAASPEEAVDDLTAIKGLGKVKVAKLAALGITSYAQVAAWTDEDIAEVGLKVNTSPGQIKREDWVGQARTLAEG